MARIGFTLRKGEEKIGWSCESETKLDKLREDLKADDDARELLGDGDVFLLDGAPLAKSREKDTSVKTALGGAKMLVVQAGGGGEEENVAITLDFGAGSKVRRTVNVKMFLHDLRQELAKLDPPMAAADRFVVDGSEIPDEDEEKNTPIEAVLKKNVLTVKRAAVKPGSVRVKLDFGEDHEISYEVKPEMLLSDLRKELAGKTPPLMAEGDRFLVDGAILPVSQEKDPESKVEIALKKNVLTIKKKEGAASPVTLGKGTGTAPKIDTLKASPDKLTYTANTSAATALTQLKADTAAAKSATLEYYYKLKDKAKRDLLLNKLQLRNGLTFRPNGFTQADEQVVEMDAFPGMHIPADVLDSTSQMTFSETVHELRKKGVETNSNSAGFAGIGLSTKYTKETESLTVSKKTKVFLWASQDIPKVELFVQREALRPTGAFVDAVRGAVGTSGDLTEANYTALLDVLNLYGFYAAMRVWLGGQIYAEQSQEISEQVQANREMESFQVAFEVSLEVVGYPVKAGTSYGQLNEEQKKDINVQASKRISKKAKGGDPAAVNAPATFITTLGKAESWAVIKYLELLPTPDLLPAELKARCAQAIDKYCLSPNTAKKTTLDMKKYALALNVGGSDDFV
jgi:hypothetical protein